LVGGADAVLVIDDTALPKKGTQSVGSAPAFLQDNRPLVVGHSEYNYRCAVGTETKEAEKAAGALGFLIRPRHQTDIQPFR
jgi:hypothetical protein